MGTVLLGKKEEDRGCSQNPRQHLQNLPCSPSFPRTPTEPQGQDPKTEVSDINPVTGLENRCLRGGEDQKEEKTRNRKMCLCACMWRHVCMCVPVTHRGGVNRDQGGRWTPLREKPLSETDTQRKGLRGVNRKQTAQWEYVVSCRQKSLECSLCIICSCQVSAILRV